MTNFFRWKPTDNLLSLGAGAAWWEVKILYENPAEKIYLIDENPEVLNENDVNEGINYFKKYYLNPFITEINIIQEKVENFDERILKEIDWILCFNSWHEFKNPEIILKKLSNRIKLGTYFLLEENLSVEKREFHKECGFPLYFEDELFNQFIKFGFELVEREQEKEAPYLLFRKNF